MEGEAAEGGEGGGGIQRLPEGCVSQVLSLTSPRDACRSAAVSWTFRSAAESDVVWERFLPPDYGEILARAAAPVEYSSKRELFFRLCGSILIDGGRKSFSMERSSGKRCFMLSARELAIVWGDTPSYWRWVVHPESRFSEVAELVDVCWLEIRGKLNCRMLSQNTRYVAYLIFKIAEDSRGLGYRHEASLKVGAHTCERVVYLQPGEQREPRMAMRGRRVRLGPRRGVGFPHLPPGPPPEPPAMWPMPLPVDVHPPPPPAVAEEPAPEPPRARDDGWMEIQIGEFYNDKGDDGEVDMSLVEVKGGHWKNGLIVEGFELRPRR